MYNRYIPQPDGTYRRSRQQEQLKKEPPPPPPEKNIPICPEIPHAPPSSPKMPPCRPENCPRNKPEGKCPPTEAGSFLRNLLPKDLDTGDLLIIILLLLMAGDCAEDQNTAILTLALYLFL